MQKQKLLIAVLIVAILAVIGSYFALVFIKETMDKRRYKGMDSTLSSLQRLEKMKTEGAIDFSFTVIDAFDKVNLPDLNGEQSAEEKVVKKLSDYKGQPILLNFWASWCEPCIKEFPDLITLAQKVPGLVILAVSRDNTLEEAESFIRAFPESKQHLVFSWDPQGDITRSYGTEVLPESFIIRKDFKVDKKISGIEAWGSDNIINYFKALSSQKNDNK